MVPLRDITSSILRENSFRENVQTFSIYEERNDLVNIFNNEQNNNDRNTTTSSSPAPLSARRTIRSRSLPGNTQVSNMSLSSRKKRISQQYLSLSPSKMNAIDSVQDRLNFMKLSSDCLPSSEGHKVFTCCCNTLKNSTPVTSQSRRRLHLEMESSSKTNKNYLMSNVYADNLRKMLFNIKKALPNRVYGSRRCAVSFRRVEYHILLMKDVCLQQCRELFQNGHWDDLMKYIFCAVKIVVQMPTWDNTAHNLHRTRLLNVLGTYCQKCLLVANFDKAYLQDVKTQMEKSAPREFKVKVTRVLSQFIIM